MNTRQDEFFQSIDGDMTPEQAAQLLELSGEGDTGTPQPETGGEAPDASADAGKAENNDLPNDEPPTDPKADEGQPAEPEPKGQATEPEGEPEPTLLAKDGKHTIPYEKLSEAREGERHWREQAESAQRELDALKQQAQQRSDDGEAATETDQNAQLAQQAIDEGIDPGIFGDFTEEDLAKGVNALIESKLEARLREQAAQQEQKNQEQQQISQAEQHYGAIYEAHPDADSIGESKELDDWINSQPSYVQAGINDVLERGSAQQVIELFNSFKEATGKTEQQAESPSDVRAAAKDAISKAEAPEPNSLSDIPGGRSSAVTPEEQMADMEGKDLLDRMQDMDPEKIESLMNKLI